MGRKGKERIVRIWTFGKRMKLRYLSGLLSAVLLAFILSNSSSGEELKLPEVLIWGQDLSGVIVPPERDRQLGDAFRDKSLYLGGPSLGGEEFFGLRGPVDGQPFATEVGFSYGRFDEVCYRLQTSGRLDNGVKFGAGFARLNDPGESVHRAYADGNAHANVESPLWKFVLGGKVNYRQKDYDINPEPDTQRTSLVRGEIAVAQGFWDWLNLQFRASAGEARVKEPVSVRANCYRAGTSIDTVIANKHLLRGEFLWQKDSFISGRYAGLTVNLSDDLSVNRFISLKYGLNWGSDLEASQSKFSPVAMVRAHSDSGWQTRIFYDGQMFIPDFSTLYIEQDYTLVTSSIASSGIQKAGLAIGWQKYGQGKVMLTCSYNWWDNCPGSNEDGSFRMPVNLGKKEAWQIEGVIEYPFVELLTLEVRGVGLIGDTIIGTPEWNMNVLVKSELGKFSADMGFSAVGSRYYEVTMPPALSPYWTLSAGARYNISRYFGVYFNASNLLSEEYEPVYGYGFSKLRAQFGIELRL